MSNVPESLSVPSPGTPYAVLSRAVATLAVLMLTVAATAGFTSRDPVGRRAGTNGRPAVEDGEAKKGKANEKGPPLKVMRSYYLAPADVGGDVPDYEDQVDMEWPKVRNLTDQGDKKSGFDQKVGTITMDVRDLSGKVVFKDKGMCKGEGARVTCPMYSDDDESRSGPYLRATKKSRIGDSGYLHYTFKPRRPGATLKARTRVTIGRPKLGVKQPRMLKRAKGDVAVPITFKNVGDVPTRGVAVTVRGLVKSLPEKKRYRNCRYRTRGYQQGLTCYFPDARIHPGETRTAKFALHVPPSRVMYEEVGYDVRPLDFSAQDDISGRFGRGSPAELMKPSDKRGPFPTHADPRIVVQRDVHADYEAFDTRITGASGGRAHLRVRIRNNGPGTFDIATPRGGSSAKVTIPPGSTVMKAPRELVDEDEYVDLCKGRGRTYDCSVGVLERGRTDTLDFTLRLDDNRSLHDRSAKGKVQIIDAERESRRDDEPGNDTAVVTLTVTPNYALPISLALGLIGLPTAVVLGWRHRAGLAKLACRLAGGHKTPRP